MNAYLALLLGLVFAGGGGELFVRGTIGLASAARISPGIIAATVAAFATSSPEFSATFRRWATSGSVKIAFAMPIALSRNL